MQRWCGIDWAEHDHDIAIVDETGALVSKARLEDNAAGFAELMDLLAVHGQGCDAPVPVAIETAKGLLVANLRAAGVPVYAFDRFSARGLAHAGSEIHLAATAFNLRKIRHATAY